MTISARDAVITFKTNAWQHAGQVSWYAERMHENRGTNRLKNAVEIGHIRENIRGKRIIDVGIGTGRGSLPLLRDGLRVAGVDASQAMLDQCRREAGDLQIDLIAADLTKLPVPDESFDSAISLNVVSHFPNWRNALADWVRVVKPGGRIVFDVHSSDHIRAVAAAHRCGPDDLLTVDQREKPEHYFLRIGLDDIEATANELGLSIVALIPYAAILGGGNINYWLRDSLLWGEYGDRALSWMAADEKLFEFGAFIEQRVIARLSTHATPRFMAVLEKTKDPDRTRRTIEYHRTVATVLGGGEPTFAQLRELVGSDAEAWRSEIAGYLEHEPNRTLLAMAFSSPVALHLRGLINELLGSTLSAAVYDANDRQRVDDAVHDFVRTWHTELVDPKHFAFKGVDLGASLEYELMRDLLMVEYFDRKGQSQ